MIANGFDSMVDRPAAAIAVSSQQHPLNIPASLEVPALGQPKAFVHGQDGLLNEADRITTISRKLSQS
jgi:hypothetical protein